MDTVQSFSVRGRTFVLPRERLGVEEVLDRDVEFFQVIHDFLHSPPRYLAVECENSEGAVPVLNFRIPAEWLEKEALFWQEQSFYQLFELEMAMWSAVLERLLKTYLSDQVFQSWPGRDRHQLWASLWLALRFLPERRYTPRELRAVVAASFGATQRLQLLSAVEAELRRRNFLEEVPEGVRLCMSGVKWVLDGDKFFRSRKPDTKKAWWQLPLNSQQQLLQGGALPAPAAQVLGPGSLCTFAAYRVVFLGEDEGFLAKVCVSFKGPRGEEVATSARCRWSSVSEEQSQVPCMEFVPESGPAVECLVSAESLPPLRIDGKDGEWWVLCCQPMPTAEEICSHRRGDVRCFLPRAVPESEDAESLAARGALEAPLASFLVAKRLKQWPLKGKAQRLAALWLCLRLVPNRAYTEGEVDWIIATGHFCKVPDCGRIRKDLERTGYVRREPGGGDFQLCDKLEQLRLEATSG